MSPRTLENIEAVVVGASAGGIEALTVLLRALPVDFTAAMLIVQHLSRGRESRLREIFASKCVLPVRDASDKMRIKHGHVYLAPSDYHLLVDDEDGPQLALSIDEPVHFSRPSIDVLFESAADVYQHRLMGVVLTGANSDGAQGLDAIRHAGGVTVVQDPETAAYPAMPAAALSLGRPDFVLSLALLAELLKTMSGSRAVSLEPSKSPFEGQG